MSPVDVLQAALEGEHAAVYAYGVVGARLQGQRDEAAAVAAYNTHRQRRSTLTRLVVAAGAQPTPAAVAYDLAGPVVTAGQARALAGRVEIRAATTYSDVVSAFGAGTRSAAAAWLADAAVRAAAWSGRPSIFPGMPERSG